MRIIDTPFVGLKIIEAEIHEDQRGGFARAYCIEEFKEVGIDCYFVQDNLSYNIKKNTIRGMHWQSAPYGEEKMIRCLRGAVYDVVVDMRKNQSTYGKWFGVELSANNNQALFIPKGFAHGYQTLEDDTAVYYKVSEFYHPECAMGLRYNDDKINIPWKELEEELIISQQDKSWPSL